MGMGDGGYLRVAMCSEAVGNLGEGLRYNSPFFLIFVAVTIGKGGR